MRPEPARHRTRALMVALALAGVLPAGAGAAVPPVPVPPGNPVTADKAVLGKILFWDEQLSSDDSVACGTCHMPEQAGSDPRSGTNPGSDGVFGTADDVRGSSGVLAMDASGYVADPTYGFSPQVTGRATPTIYGSLWSPLLFWDGRAGPAFLDPQTGATVLPRGGALENQALGPLLNDVEMSHAGRDWTGMLAKVRGAEPLALATDLPGDVADKLASSPTYAALFTDAFGSPDITASRVAMAIATYERTLVPDQTPYDLFQAGQVNALTQQQRIGLQTLRGTPCGICHAGDLFTDNTFRNIGLRPIAEDAGRFDITGAPPDQGRFKVPSLRNVGLKTEFMHTGHLTSLEAVIDFYLARNGQVQFRPNQDPLIANIRIAPPDVVALIDFLRNGLTDPRVAAATYPFDRPTLHASLDACRDGVDNDGDGVVDLLDTGCVSRGDTTETAMGELGLVLDVGPVTPGSVLTLTATGAPVGAAVSFLVSTRGPGAGPCVPTAGVCADILAPSVIGTVVAGVDGLAVRSVTVPGSVTPGAQVAFQAAWIQGGTGDTSGVVLKVVTP